jgi:ketosteroid isomerase-like protein
MLRPALLLLTLLVATPTLAQRALSDSVAATVRAVFHAAERGDMEVLGRLYDPDVTIGEGAGLDRGWIQYRDHHLVPELREFRNFRYRPFAIEVRMISPRSAYALFRYGLRADTAERAVVGRGTMVLQRGEDGRWRVVHSHTSGRARRDSDPAFPQ